VINDAFFNEFTVKLPMEATAVVEALARQGILGGVPVSRLEPGKADLANLLLVASSEVNSDEDRDAFVAALKEVLA
jgi:glycine dehydrogenase subunit 1